jgi:hypothetical protein
MIDKVYYYGAPIVAQPVKTPDLIIYNSDQCSNIYLCQ